MTQKKKWFFMLNNAVSGPFDEKEMEPLLAQNPTGLVWGQGLSEWMDLNQWKTVLASLQEVLTSLQADMTKSWSFQFQNQITGPLTYDGLIVALKSHSHASEVLLQQSSESPQWKSIWEHPTLVEEIGITRREHTRVPLSGTFRFEKNGSPQEALLSSISEGGLGIQDAQGLAIGEQLKGEVQSPQLATSFNCTCEVMTHQPEGGWGLKFLSLPSEALTVIGSYTKLGS